VSGTDNESCPETEPLLSGELAGAEVVSSEPGEAPVIVTGSREQLFHLLAEAAEVEHCLMCSYLYAAFSLKTSTADGLSPEQAEAVTRWREAIMNVAIQEMGHLLILANLTTAIGGRPHFSRPNFPVSPGYFPSGVVVRLSGFSLKTLEHFIFLERPKGGADEDAAEYDQDAYSRRQVHLGLMPNAQHYSTIGFLYDAIRENLISLTNTLGEDVLFSARQAMQLAPPVVDMPGIERITRLETALTGIDLIVEQGEGSPEDQEDTHYRAFRQIHDEYQEILEADPDFAPAWPVADNPVLRSPPEPEDKIFIDHPESAPLLDFTCAAYGLLLRVLTHCFGDQLKSEAQQERLFNAAVGLMHVLGTGGSALAMLPASEEHPQVNAGMSFTMLRGVEPLLGGAIGDQLLREQVERLKQGMRTCSNLPDAVYRCIGNVVL
jgi:hypothetical protein